VQQKPGISHPDIFLIFDNFPPTQHNQTRDRRKTPFAFFRVVQALAE